MGKDVQPYAENGIILSKSSLSAGDEISVSYSGLLAASGADMVYMHVGYGDTWEEKIFIPMDFDEGVFKTSFKVSSEGKLNISFKDSANNWDNNSQNNYSFEVKTKKAKVTAVKEEKAEETKAEKKAAPKATAKKVSAKKAAEVKDESTVAQEKVEAPKKTTKKVSTAKKSK